ncbi:MAG: tetratricopeptide repeat protein [Ferruginibacter sp.]
MRKLFCGIILLFLAGNLSAQFTKILSIPFPKQYAALDSAFNSFGVGSVYHPTLVEELLATAYKTKDQLTILNCKRAVLNYQYACSSANGSVSEYTPIIGEANKLLEETDEKKYPEIEAMIYTTIANTYYYKLKQFSEAFEYYLKAYDIFKNVPIERYPDRQYSQYSIALAYYQFNDYKNATRLGNEIETIYPAKNYVSIYNIDMIGMSYLRMQQYDSAISQFQWIIDNLKLAKNPVAWKGIASGNIGLAYFLQHDYDKALPYLKTSVELTLAADVPDNAADFAAYTATIYLDKQNPALAKKYLDTAQEAAYKANTASNFYNVYKAFADYYKQTGNAAQALVYRDSSIIFKDSLAKINNVNLKYQGEMQVEEARKKQQEKIIEEERARQILTRNGLIILIILVMIITLLYYNRVRLKNMHREEQFLKEKQLAETELNNASTQLNDFTKSIIEKNELLEIATLKIEQLNSAYKELQDQKPGDRSSKIDDHSLKLLQESVLLTDEHWKNFTQLFEKVYPGFFFRLKEKLPGLSPAETRLVALTKLKLNNKEMAAMLGVGTDAIRQSKSRFRKKLNLAEEAAIEDEIDRI